MENYIFNPFHFVDKNETLLQLGDLVEVTKGSRKGGQYYFVFCIPQHRYGFFYWESYERIEKHIADGLISVDKMTQPFIVDVPNVDFYWTPKSKTEIVKI